MSWRTSSTGPASFGQYRGTPYNGGSGSGYGASVNGTGRFAQGQGTTSSAMAATWSPTILYLLVLVIAEMVIFGWLSRKV
jgi:hypothetical protein